MFASALNINGHLYEKIMLALTGNRPAFDNMNWNVDLDVTVMKYFMANNDDK